MITFENVYKNFGDKEVLRGMSFVGHTGAVTGFVGANGSGKTTAIKILAGIEPAVSGRALIDGMSAAEGFSESSRSFSMFLGGATIPGYFTGYSYLAYICDLVGVSQSEIAPALARVGLASASGVRVRKYSMGMKQRLGIAGAFLGSPSNVVLDEPVNGLDVEGVRWMRHYLREVADQGATVLLSSHLMSELELVADYVVILADGVIKRQGAVAELLVDESATTFVESVASSQLATLLSDKGAAVERVRGGLEVRGMPISWVAVAVGESGVEFTSIGHRKRSIESVYLMETDRSDHDV